MRRQAEMNINTSNSLKVYGFTFIKMYLFKDESNDYKTGFFEKEQINAILL